MRLFSMPILHGTQVPPDLVAKIAAIPRVLLPEGVAREQLVQEVLAGGPLLDVYTKDPMTDDFTGGGPMSHVIERPLRGRTDSRWSPVEWRQWVEAGMPTTPCDFCGHPPAFFPMPDYRLADGQPATLCYTCHSALLGIHGMGRLPVLTCTQCGRLDLQLNPTWFVCRDCLLGGHYAP
jgi:hypothetical protein